MMEWNKMVSVKDDPSHWRDLFLRLAESKQIPTFEQPNPMDYLFQPVKDKEKLETDSVEGIPPKTIGADGHMKLPREVSNVIRPPREPTPPVPNIYKETNPGIKSALTVEEEEEQQQEENMKAGKRKRSQSSSSRRRGFRQKRRRVSRPPARRKRRFVSKNRRRRPNLKKR